MSTVVNIIPTVMEKSVYKRYREYPNNDREIMVKSPKEGINTSATTTRNAMT